jgi:hypothetical protein
MMKKGFRRKCVRRSFLILSFTAMHTVVFGSSTQAWTQMVCGYDSTAVKWSTPTLKFINSGGAYGTSAASAYGAASGPLSLSVVTSVYNGPHFWVKVADYGGALGAYGIFRKINTENSLPSCGGGFWVAGSGEVLSDTSLLPNSNAIQSNVSHEMGHALGIYHNDTIISCNGGPGVKAASVMASGPVKWTTPCPVTLPQADDNAGMQALYGK